MVMAFLKYSIHRFSFQSINLPCFCLLLYLEQDHQQTTEYLSRATEQVPQTSSFGKGMTRQNLPIR